MVIETCAPMRCCIIYFRASHTNKFYIIFRKTTNGGCTNLSGKQYWAWLIYFTIDSEYQSTSSTVHSVLIDLFQPGLFSCQIYQLDKQYPTCLFSIRELNVAWYCINFLFWVTKWRFGVVFELTNSILFVNHLLNTSNT